MILADMNTNVKSFFKDMKTMEPQFKAYYKMDFMPILCLEQERGRHSIQCYIYINRISNFIAETVQSQNFHLVGRLLNNALCTSRDYSALNEKKKDDLYGRSTAVI
jgi:hypothetical protein